MRKRKRRRLKRSVWVVLSAVLVLSVGLIAWGSRQNRKLEPEPSSKIQIKVLKNTSMKHIEYPETQNPEINKKILSFIQSQKEIAPELEISVQVKHEQNQILSFLYEIYLYEEKEPELRTQNFHENTGQELKLEDLFDEEQYLELLSFLAPENLKHLNNLNKNSEFYFTPERELEILLSREEVLVVKLSDLGTALKTAFRLQSSTGEIVTAPQFERRTEPSTRAAQELEELNNKKLVALTFDDGPHGVYTKQLLDLLKREAVSATFFMLGIQMKEYPGLVERAAQEGHQVANHSWSHKDLTKLSASKRVLEINQSAEILKAYNEEEPVLRPPYGARNKEVLASLATPAILWSVDPLDWKYKDAERVAKHILENTKDGSIVLLHDIYESSVLAAAKIIPELKKRGYEFVTIRELLQIRGEAKPGELVFMREKK